MEPSLSIQIPLASEDMLSPCLLYSLFFQQQHLWTKVNLKLQGLQENSCLFIDFFNPLITQREWQDRAFLKMQVNSQQAGQNQSLDYALGASTYGAGIADINPTAVRYKSNCCHKLLQIHI